jgi:TM2 domain-containing membrane protein YozV
MKCGAKVVQDAAVPASVVNHDSQKESRVRCWLAANASKLPENQLPILKDRLMAMSDAELDRLTYVNLTDPLLMLVISICFGVLGIDRFVLGDIGLGVGKLITCGGIYIWWIVDLFYIMDDTKEKNLQRLNTALLY